MDHAGEFGADRIYAGQMAVLGDTEVSFIHVLLKVKSFVLFQVGPMIQQMWDQEKHHLATFDKLIPEHRARPTALLPFWAH